MYEGRVEGVGLRVTRKPKHDHRIREPTESKTDIVTTVYTGTKKGRLRVLVSQDDISSPEKKACGKYIETTMLPRKKERRSSTSSHVALGIYIRDNVPFHTNAASIQSMPSHGTCDEHAYPTIFKTPTVLLAQKMAHAVFCAGFRWSQVNV